MLCWPDPDDDEPAPAPPPNRKKPPKIDDMLSLLLWRGGEVVVVVVVVVVVLVLVLVLVLHPLGMLRNAVVWARLWNFLRISVINPTNQAQIAVK